MNDPTSADSQPADGATLHDRVAVLIDRWLDNAITSAEIVEMESALLESSEARRDFWHRAGLHGLLHEAARVKFATVPDEAAGPKISDDAVRTPVMLRRWTTERVRGWLRADVAAACCLLVAMGGGIGSFVTSRAAASAGRNATDGVGPIVVVAESFESPPAPAESYLPTALDCWGGDETRVVGPETWSSSGMLPHSGRSMLRFVSGHPRGVDYPGVASEIWRFVDLDELRALAGSKDIRVELSAWFNSVAPGEGRRPLCGLRAVATHLGPGEVKDTMWVNSGLLEDIDAVSNGAPPMAASKTEDRFDTDLASWQQLTVVLSLPPGSPRYLLVHCYALDRSEAANASADRLPGQYVDDISLTVEPADASRASRAARLETIPGPR
jgi:hypothetical protein